MRMMNKLSDFSQYRTESLIRPSIFAIISPSIQLLPEAIMRIFSLAERIAFLGKKELRREGLNCPNVIPVAQTEEVLS